MIKESGKFKWIDKGDEESLLFYYTDLWEDADNFGEMVDFISEEYHVYGLDLKLFEGNILKVSVKNLSDYLFDFMNHLENKKVVLIGNSMGGHMLH